MAKLWADQIKKGKKTLDQVPNKLREAVEKLLEEEHAD